MAKILLIEDNGQVNENISELLQLEGHEVLSAHDGANGIELALANLPELIICDIQMPKMTGHEVLNNLKASPSTEKIPFVFITAYGDTGNVKKGLKMGATAYLPKPFSDENILSVVNNCLNEGQYSENV